MFEKNGVCGVKSYSFIPYFVFRIPMPYGSTFNINVITCTKQATKVMYTWDLMG